MYDCNNQRNILNFRLCGDRGILVLRYFCDDIKFKGKGYEVIKCEIVIRSELFWRKFLKNFYEI